MTDYMDKMFDKAVKGYNEYYKENPILARRSLMHFLGAKETGNVCTLCTRECPVRNNGIISCNFNNSHDRDSCWYIGG